MRSILLLILLLFPAYGCSQNIDIRILRSLNSPNNLAADKAFEFISDSNYGVILGVPVTLGVAGFIKHDGRLIRNSCLLVAASGINMVITYALKYSIDRKRPFQTYPDLFKKSAGGSPSFPSAHTSAAFASATMLSLEYPKWYVIVPSYLWSGAVGYSRLHLGVHYPSDVLGGIITGAGSAFLTYKINNWLNNRCKHASSDQISE